MKHQAGLMELFGRARRGRPSAGSQGLGRCASNSRRTKGPNGAQGGPSDRSVDVKINRRGLSGGQGIYRENSISVYGIKQEAVGAKAAPVRRSKGRQTGPVKKVGNNCAGRDSFGTCLVLSTTPSIITITRRVGGKTLFLGDLRSFGFRGAATSTPFGVAGFCWRSA